MKWVGWELRRRKNRDVQMIFLPFMEQNVNHNNKYSYSTMWIMQVISISRGHVKSNMHFSIPKCGGFWANYCLFVEIYVYQSWPHKPVSWKLERSSPVTCQHPPSLLSQNACAVPLRQGLAPTPGLNSAFPGQWVSLCRLRQMESPPARALGLPARRQQRAWGK